MVVDSTRDAIRKELDDLVDIGLLWVVNAPAEALNGPAATKSEIPINAFEYQSWYTRALACARQLIPDRLSEFQSMYDPPSYRKTKVTGQEEELYGIRQYINGVRIRKFGDFGLFDEDAFDHDEYCRNLIAGQVAILRSAASRLESSLSDITGVLRAQIFDSELSAAKELLRGRLHRSAGVIAGVVLERHLAVLLDGHGGKCKKQKPTISDFNDALRELEVIDLPTWRLIQRLADIRNLCAHPKDREPMSDEVSDLVRDTDKVVKSVF